MEDIKTLQNAEEYLKSVWAAVRLNLRRDPCEETFNALDAFVEKYKIFFDEKVLEPFSYETLFQHHFPWFYKRLKTPFGNHDWRCEFLLRSHEMYKKDCKKFSAIINNDLVILREMISNGELSLNDFKFNEPKNLLHCMYERGTQETKDLIFNSIFASLSLPALDPYTHFCTLLFLHRPMEEIKRAYERFPTEKHKKRLADAVSSGHLEAIRFLMLQDNEPIKYVYLKSICYLGDLETLKIALNSPRLESPLEKHTYIMLIYCARESDRIEVLSYLIEQAVHFGFQFDINDYQYFVLNACVGGDVAIVKRLFEFISQAEWREAFFQDTRFFARLCEKLFDGDHSLRLGIFVCLLNHGISLDLILDQYNSYGKDEFEAALESGFHPPALKQRIIRNIQASVDSGCFPLSSEDEREAILALLAYLNDPTEENAQRLEKEPTRQLLIQEQDPLLKLFLPPSIFPKEKARVVPDEAKPAEMSEFNITPENIGARTVQQFHEWEFIKLIREALRNGTPENAYNIADYSEKYGENFSPEVMAYYERSKSFFVFPLGRLPKDIFRLILFGVPRKDWSNVALINKSFPPRVRDAAEAQLEAEFRYRYPREYQRVLRANPQGNIDWEKKLNETEKRAYVNFIDFHKALFHAIRSPAISQKMVQEILNQEKSNNFLSHDPLLMRPDAVEGENIYQCAKRKGLQWILDAMYLKFSADAKMKKNTDAEDQVRLFSTAVILCHQPREKVKAELEEIKRSKLDFNEMCYISLNTAIRAENTEAADFLFEQTKMKLEANFLRGALHHNSIIMTWWLIAHGADLKAFLAPAKMKTGRDVDDPADLAFKKLIGLTLEQCERDKKFEPWVRDVLANIMSEYAKPFYEWHFEEENSVRDSHKSKKDLAEEKARREKNRVIYKSLQALLKIMRDPLNDERLEALQAPDIQKGLAEEEVAWLYAVCRPFFSQSKPTLLKGPSLM